MKESEINHLRGILACADQAANEIADLTQAIDCLWQAHGVSLCFTTFEIRHKVMEHSLSTLTCTPSLLADLKEEFRSALIAIIARRLDERKAELDALKLA